MKAFIVRLLLIAIFYMLFEHTLNLQPAILWALVVTYILEPLIFDFKFVKNGTSS